MVLLLEFRLCVFIGLGPFYLPVSVAGAPRQAPEAGFEALRTSWISKGQNEAAVIALWLARSQTCGCRWHTAELPSDSLVLSLPAVKREKKTLKGHFGNRN